MVRSVLAVFCAMRDNLVLNAIWVFEEERVVTCGFVLWIHSRRSDNKSTNSLDFVVKPINLCTGFCSKREVVKRARSAPMNRIALKSLSRRCDREREKRVAVLHHEEVVLFDRRTRSTFLAKAKERKKEIVERHGHCDIANRYLDVINDRLHVGRFQCKPFWMPPNEPSYPAASGPRASAAGEASGLSGRLGCSLLLHMLPLRNGTGDHLKQRVHTRH